MKKRNVFTRYCLVILIILSANGFLNPFGLMTQAQQKACFYVVWMIAVVYLLCNKTEEPHTGYSKLGLRLIVFGMLTSMLIVYLFQNQSVQDSLITTSLYLLAYLTLPIMARLSLPQKQLLRIVYVFAVLGMAAYVVNLISFPTIVFGDTKDEYDMSRGFIRLGVPFILCIQIVLLHRANNWANGIGRHNIAWMSLASVFILLSLTRQVILLSAVMTVLIILQNASWFRRIITIAVSLLVLYLVLSIPVVKTMIELSEHQAEINKYEKEDIRITAWRYYTIENQTNSLTPVFGNGVPRFGYSPWGIKAERDVAPEWGGNACYQADVGWAGFYWYFGAIGTVGLLMLLLGAAMHKKKNEDSFASYMMWTIIITSVASAPILYHYQVVIVMLMICYIYGKEDSNNNPQLQQLRGHVQLH